jgi:hypothetical protein
MYVLACYDFKDDSFVNIKLAQIYKIYLMKGKNKKKKKIKDEDIFDLDICMAKFILPRLKIFRKNIGSYPGCIIEESLSHLIFWEDYKDAQKISKNQKKLCDDLCIKTWEGKIDSMIEAFEVILQGVSFFENYELKQSKIKNGLNNFAKYYTNLWL